MNRNRQMRGACLTHIMNRERQMRGVFKIHDEPEAILYGVPLCITGFLLVLGLTPIPNKNMQIIQ